MEEIGKVWDARNVGMGRYKGIKSTDNASASSTGPRRRAPMIFWTFRSQPCGRFCLGQLASLRCEMNREFDVRLVEQHNVRNRSSEIAAQPTRPTQPTVIAGLGNQAVKRLIFSKDILLNKTVIAHVTATVGAPES